MTYLLDFLPFELNNKILFEQQGLQTPSSKIIRDHIKKRKEIKRKWVEETYSCMEDIYFLKYIEFTVWKLGLPDSFLLDIVPFEKRKRKDVIDWMTDHLFIRDLTEEDFCFVGI